MASIIYQKISDSSQARWLPSKVWSEIAYPFPNFNGIAVEVWKWIGSFAPHYMMDVITYPGCDQSKNHISKRALVEGAV